MKILVICQYYYPEPFRITDVCEELVKLGHNVTVVTGTPNYPMGNIYSGYENRSRQDEVINGVKVHRCVVHPRKNGTVHRLWNYYSYSCASSRYIKRLDASFDVVFINQLSPVMMANAGIKYARKHKKKSVLYCLDLWPASLGAGGINSGPVYKFFHKVSRRIYRAVDKVLVSSKSFSRYFEDEFKIYNTDYFPQYAESLFTVEECKKPPNEYIDLMFAGNVGAAQKVDTIIRAAARCKDVENLRWHIVGDGKEIDSCKKLASELNAPVIFHGRKPIEEMPKYYAMADAMLVTMQNDPIISLTLPGKVQSYMAAGKFVIATDRGELSAVVKECDCGLCCDTDDPEAFASCVKNFIEMNSKAKCDMENNSYSAYIEKFSKSKFMDCLVEEFCTS